MLKAELARLLAVARGEEPADLLLANARIINVFNGEIEPGNVAVSGERIAGIGDYQQAKQVIDLEGKYLAPGFIDGHTHLESSMLDIGEYARAVVPRGTLGIVTDLHEIANVAGLAGMRYVLDAARRLPLELYLMAPSCVPATHLETSGASLGADEIRQVLRWRRCIGLGEMMNFPGVIGGIEAVLDKIESVQNGIIDGHAPGVSGKSLNAYIAAGIYSDHESTSLTEAAEKLKRGMWVMIREGSSEKNLETLLPLVTDRTFRRCFFVVDDRSAADLLHDGDIDAVVRKAIRLGLEPVRAIQMATLNPAGYFRLGGVGAIAPGYLANLIVLGDLGKLTVESVLHRGWPVARDGAPLFHLPQLGKGLTGTVKIGRLSVEDLNITAKGQQGLVIELVPGQIITRKLKEQLKIENGHVVPDTSRDILKLAVIERHRTTGNIGLGLVKGSGLTRGAIASSIAHDSHNIVAAGTNDADILAAVREIERMGGGLVVIEGGRVLASLPLPVAGLLSTEPLENVAAACAGVEHAARGLGAKIPAPFAALSFLALPVIPELRLTDRGLVDVNAFKLVGFFQ